MFGLNLSISTLACRSNDNAIFISQQVWTEGLLKYRYEDKQICSLPLFTHTKQFISRSVAAAQIGFTNYPYCEGGREEEKWLCWRPQALLGQMLCWALLCSALLCSAVLWINQQMVSALQRLRHPPACPPCVSAGVSHPVTEQGPHWFNSQTPAICGQSVKRWICSEHWTWCYRVPCSMGAPNICTIYCSWHNGCSILHVFQHRVIIEPDPGNTTNTQIHVKQQPVPQVPLVGGDVLLRYNELLHTCHHTEFPRNLLNTVTNQPRGVIVSLPIWFVTDHDIIVELPLQWHTTER